MFEFDYNKNIYNKEKHGISLSEAIVLWESDCIIVPAKNISDEKRQMIIGSIEEKIYVCIFTIRDDKIRLISCHRADKKIERYYYEKIKQENSR